MDEKTARLTAARRPSPTIAAMRSSLSKNRRVAVTTLAALPLLLVACGDDTDTGQDPAQDTASETAESTADGPACTYAADGQDPAKEVTPPPSTATVEGEVTATIETSVGTLTATMDADQTPCTVGSFASLAEQGYFDATTCHRLTTLNIFVLQCGDPTASGTGGPGYTIPDELTGEETYPAGTLAMANTGQPDTGGSQFFVVYDATQLPAQYTVFGTIDEASTELVQEVAADGTVSGTADGAPKTPVEIESVTIG